MAPPGGAGKLNAGSCRRYRITRYRLVLFAAVRKRVVVRKQAARHERTARRRLVELQAGGLPRQIMPDRQPVWAKRA
ncbi:hypothetical protein GCM10027456_44550 [Kineosporia babensis]